MGVSGEFRYLVPAFSSLESVRPVKAMTLPASLEIGNIARLRNLEYIASPESRVLSPEPLRFLSSCAEGRISALCRGSPVLLSSGDVACPWCPWLTTRDSELGASFAVSFHENSPLSLS